MNKYIDILINDNAQMWSRVDGLPCISKFDDDYCYTICLFGKGNDSFVSINVDKIKGADYLSNIFSDKVPNQDPKFVALQRLYFTAKQSADLIRV